MAGLAVLIALSQATLSVEPVSYHVAFRDAVSNQRPLVVLVGATWCPGCQTVKTSVLPELARRGRLRSVSLAMVDIDAEPEMARHLMRGNGLPQIIVFSRKSSGDWNREQLTGIVSETQVQALISRALASQETPRIAAGGGN
jgi:thioredoxin-like negative regulator of GroEL